MNIETLVIDRNTTAIVIYAEHKLTPNGIIHASQKLREALKNTERPDVPIVICDNGLKLGILKSNEPDLSTMNDGA